MKKFLAIFLTTFMLTSCGEKPVEPVVAEPKLEKVSFVGCGDNITYIGFNGESICI